ncbi:MAG: proton-conducting transporter membrane subunit [Eubacteriales bacterium]|nr:proton-conducting transporter membrane subunit [Eubacteriales bacterium]
MQLVQNVPFFCIMLSMASAVTAAMLPKRVARWWTVALSAVVLLLNVWLLTFLIPYGASYTYMMGHYPSPWGNELRAGVLEAVMGVAFSAIMLLSVLGGFKKIDEQIDDKKQNLLCVMLDLVLAALMSLVYTNDLFTGYVFIEILTLSSCALIMARQNGHAMVAAMRYMIMSLLGSGLLLIAISLTYNLTGHLLMEPIKQSFAELAASGEYSQPITVIIGLFFVGLGIKSALFPFHTWLADAYGYATPSASAVLSSLVSKAYLFLLVKIFYRVIGMDVVMGNQAMMLPFAFGVIGMIMGSLSAIHSHDLRRMIAFSSVAQIGYIYAGLGLGTTAGMVAAMYHLIMHSLAKSLLFISSSGLSDASGDSKRFADLRGAGYRYPTAGMGFTVGALSLVGVPLLGGFISKLCLAEAAFDVSGVRGWILLGALALSTLLNTLYFMHTVIGLYRKPRKGFEPQPFVKSRLMCVSVWVLAALNLLVGVFAQPVLNWIAQGLGMLA